MYASNFIRVTVAVYFWLGVSVLVAADTPPEATPETPPEATAETPSEATAEPSGDSTLKMLPQNAAETTPETAAETTTETQAETTEEAEETPQAGAEMTLQAPSETLNDVYAVAISHYSGSRWRLAAEEFSRFLELHPDHPQAPLALFFRAEAYVQQGLYALARKDFADFVAREPSHRYVPQARFRAAEAVYLTGDAETARQELERFTSEYPDQNLNAYAKTYLAELALSVRDGARAAALFKEVLERHPDGTHVNQCRFGLGRASELQGDIDSARIAYQTLSAAGGPLADDAQVQLGICLYNRGQYPEAETAFQAAIERFAESELLGQARYWLGMSQVARRDWDSAVATLQDALDQYPQHPLAPAMAFWRAEACRQGGDSASAHEGYEQVCRNWPDSPWADDSLQVQTQLALADAQYDRVISLAEQFAANYPDSPLRPHVEQSLARAYLKLRQYGPASELLQRLVESAAAAGDGDAAASATTPGATLTRQANQYYLALAYLGEEQYQTALDVLAKVEVTPENNDLYGGVQVARAMALAGLNRRAEAIEPLQKYLATGPAGEEALACRLQLIDALIQDSRLDEALQVYSQMTGQDAHQPFYLEATNRLAEAALVAGKHEEAMGLFGVLTQDGQPPEAAAKGWAGLGWANFRTGKLEPAAVAFGQLVERYPASPLAAEAAIMRAKVLGQVGRSEDALEAYLLVVKNYDKSEHAVAAMLEAARLLEKSGRKAEAIPLLRRIVQEHPNEDSLDGVLYQLAWLLTDQGQADEADRLFQQISAEYPDSAYWADATYRLAQRAASAEQYDRARQFADQLTPANCTSEILEHALFLQGQLAASTQRWQKAVGPLQELLTRFPNTALSGAASFWMAEAFYQQKEYEKAAEWFGKLKPEQLTDEPAWAPTIALRRAQMLAEQQKWQEAYDLANGIEKEFPQFVQQYEVDYLLGRCLTQQRKTAAAMERYERVIRSAEGGRTETAAMAQWMIGEAYAARLDLDQALKAYYRVESLYRYPHWQAAALVQAGKCHELKRENADALSAWRQVLAKYADSSYAAEAAERLERLNARLAAAAARSAAPSRDGGTPPSRATTSGTRVPEPESKVTPASAHVASPAPPTPTRSARRRTISEP